MIRRLMLMVVLAMAAWAQPVNIVGNWQGTLDAGIQRLRLGFHIAGDEKGELTSTIDSIDQNALGRPVQRTMFSGNKLHLEIVRDRIQFDGVLSGDGNEISGTFTQGAPLPLTLRRVDKIETLRRPQNPQPPFPYEAEDVSYESKGIHLAGTLTRPRGPGPFPAGILISGSGPQDRDGSLFGHKPFLVIADYLTRRGVAVLRVDDRGTGKSTGNSMQATLDDMAGDVLAGVAYLSGRKEIDGKHIGVIGHSEGGIVGPVAAVRSPSIGFVIMLAGTGVSGEQVLYEQAALIARGAGATEEMIAQNRQVQEMIFHALKSESDPKAAVAKMRAEWRKTSAGVPESQQGAVEKAMNQQFASVTSPEMRSFILYDPAETLRRLKVPVLALNGSRDVQVSPKQNLPAIAAALAEGGNTDFTIAELHGLNHLFQKCNECSVGEYGELEETFSRTALDAMGDWLMRHTHDVDATARR